MEPRIKEALVDLGLSIIKGLKIFVVYIVPAIVVAALTSSEFRDLVSSHPDLALYAPLINVVAVVAANLIKRRLPEDSGVSKIL